MKHYICLYGIRFLSIILITNFVPLKQFHFTMTSMYMKQVLSHITDELT